jgi:hypothetical protein
MKDDAAFVDRCFDGARIRATREVRGESRALVVRSGVPRHGCARDPRCHGDIAWATFEEWWPLAVVGWLIAMLADRRVTLGGSSS